MALRNPLAYLVPFSSEPGDVENDMPNGELPRDGGGISEAGLHYGLPTGPNQTKVIGGFWYVSRPLFVTTRDTRPIITGPSGEGIDNPAFGVPQQRQVGWDWQKVRPAYQDIRDSKTGRVERWYVDVNGTRTGTPDVLQRGVPKLELEAPGGVITDRDDPRLNTNIKPNPAASPTGDWKLGTVKSATFDTGGNFQSVATVPGWVPKETANIPPRPPARTVPNPFVAGGQITVEPEYEDKARQWVYPDINKRALEIAEFLNQRARQSSLDSAAFAALQTQAAQDRETARQAAFNQRQAEEKQLYGDLFEALNRGFRPLSNPFTQSQDETGVTIPLTSLPGARFNIIEAQRRAGLTIPGLPEATVQTNALMEGQPVQVGSSAGAAFRQAAAQPGAQVNLPPLTERQSALLTENPWGWAFTPEEEKTRAGLGFAQRPTMKGLYEELGVQEGVPLTGQQRDTVRMRQTHMGDVGKSIVAQRKAAEVEQNRLVAEQERRRLAAARGRVPFVQR